MEYLLHNLVLVCFYVLLSQSLTLASGYTKLVSLCHAGFYGIGAYTTAILSTRAGLSFWLNLPLAMLLCGLLAACIAALASRLVEDYFVICTLGIQVTLSAVLNNWIAFTHGPFGIAGIPPIRAFGAAMDGTTLFLALALFFTGAVWLLLHCIARSGFGNVLRAIGEDEIYVQSIGKNVRQAKIVSFSCSAALAAIPGALYAHYISYIDPTGFGLDESVFILSIAIIGGFGSNRGAVLASLFLVLLPESLRFLGLPGNKIAATRQLLYGLALLMVTIWGKNISPHSRRSLPA